MTTIRVVPACPVGSRLAAEVRLSSAVPSSVGPSPVVPLPVMRPSSVNRPSSLVGHTSFGLLATVLSSAVKRRCAAAVEP